METLSRKQRELAERERLILEVARRMLIERGYLGLTMDRIAGATEYSKGTIYQHFPNKEEILAALNVQTMEQRCELFERAATFQGRARERLAAVGFAAELQYRLEPDYWQSEKIVKAASIRAKTSEKRQHLLRNGEFRCQGILTGIVRDAVAQGDLDLPEGFGPADVSVTLWALTFGFQSLRETDIPFSDLGIEDMHETQQRAGELFLDGLIWKPLGHEWDWDATLERVGREVFPEELERLSGR